MDIGIVFLVSNALLAVILFILILIMAVSKPKRKFPSKGVKRTLRKIKEQVSG
jgi:flagellar biogenesis protein FliO